MTEQLIQKEWPRTKESFWSAPPEPKSPRPWRTNPRSSRGTQPCAGIVSTQERHSRKWTASFQYRCFEHAKRPQIRMDLRSFFASTPNERLKTIPWKPLAAAPSFLNQKTKNRPFLFFAFKKASLRSIPAKARPRPLAFDFLSKELPCIGVDALFLFDKEFLQRVIHLLSDDSLPSQDGYIMDLSLLEVVLHALGQIFFHRQQDGGIGLSRHNGTR